MLDIHMLTVCDYGMDFSFSFLSEDAMLTFLKQAVWAECRRNQKGVKSRQRQAAWGYTKAGNPVRRPSFKGGPEDVPMELVRKFFGAKDRDGSRIRYYYKETVPIQADPHVVIVGELSSASDKPELRAFLADNVNDAVSLAITTIGTASKKPLSRSSRKKVSAMLKRHEAYEEEKLVVRILKLECKQKTSE